jgi:hypothetical protein
LNRDPIEESGGLNLYEFVHVNPISEYDSLGKMSKCDCENKLGNLLSDPDIKKLYDKAKEKKGFWVKPCLGKVKCKESCGGAMGY